MRHTVRIHIHTNIHLCSVYTSWFKHTQIKLPNSNSCCYRQPQSESVRSLPWRQRRQFVRVPDNKTADILPYDVMATFNNGCTALQPAAKCLLIVAVVPLHLFCSFQQWLNSCSTSAALSCRRVEDCCWPKPKGTILMNVASSDQWVVYSRTELINHFTSDIYYSADCDKTST